MIQEVNEGQEANTLLAFTYPANSLISNSQTNKPFWRRY